MLRKFIKDDIKDMFIRFLPPALTLMIVAMLSALCIGKMGSDLDDTASKVVDVLDKVYVVCQRVLLVTALPAALMRVRKTLVGDEAVFWAGVPARPWKHIVSKSIAAFLLFLLSAAMYGTARLAYLRFVADGIYAKTAFYTISSDPALFVRNTLMTGAILLFSMLCVQKIFIGSAVFCLPMRSPRAAMWLTTVTAVLVLAGMYVAGFSAISRLDLFSISESSAQLLIYSYGCAFFGVMSLVLTVADTLLLSKRAEY